MGALPSAALCPQSDMRARTPPEMSNYYCHPGKAGDLLRTLDNLDDRFRAAREKSLGKPENRLAVRHGSAIV